MRSQIQSLTEARHASEPATGCRLPARRLRLPGPRAERGAGGPLPRTASSSTSAIAGQPLQGNLRHKTHLLFTWADELVHNAEILDAVEDLIGPDILCWTTNFFIKEAHSPGFVSWHQDSTYWGLDPADVVTAWVALHRRARERTATCRYSRHAQGRPAAAPRHLPTRQPAVARPGDRGRGRRVEGGRHRAAAPARCRCTTSSWCTARAPNRIDRPPHRPGDPLHPDLRAPDQGARLGDAGARHRQVPPLRPGAAAARRPRRRGAGRARRAVGRQVKALYQGTDKTGVPRLTAAARPHREGDDHDARTDPRHPAAGADAGAARVLFRARATSCSSGSSATSGCASCATPPTSWSSAAARSRGPTRSSISSPTTAPTRRGCAGCSNPIEHHPVFWDYVNHSVLPDAVADLVGPDVKFHHSKLNFKWAQGGEEVKWHYDISFWPHTNYSPLTVGTYLYDCGMEQGPARRACRSSHRIEPMLDPVRRRRQVGRLPRRRATSRRSTSRRRSTSPARPAR